jgi:hypothetical protein
VTAAFAPATVPAGESAATLTIAAAPDAAAGAATVTVRAKGAGVADALVTVPLTVTAPAAAIAVAAPPAVRVAQGGSATAEIAFTRANFAGEVTVSLDDAPSGVSAVGATAPAGASTVALGLRVAAGAATGGRSLTVRLAGPGGQPTATATLPLTVTAATAPAAVLDGVYMGIAQNAATGLIYQDYWTFLPDGRMLRTHPTEGLDRPADHAAICRLVECATYTLDGTEMRIRRQGGAETVYDFDAAGSFAERGRSARYRPLAPLDGFRVSATYAVVEPARGRTLVSLALARDGRFTEEKLMDYTSWVRLAPPGETRVPLPGGSGTYTVTRNTLALRYDGGQTAYFFFVVPPGEMGNAVPNVVYINTAPINRVP